MSSVIEFNSQSRTLIELKLMKTILSCIALVFLSACAPPSPSPYVGQETRAIKALSVNEIASLLAGKGMGFAKTAKQHGSELVKAEIALDRRLSKSACTFRCVGIPITNSN
jgi:hypothetical protein